MRHPEEGEIHAWLDGALDPAAAAALEAHVAACPVCAEAVAEARGLIAGASRILLALDGVPAGVIPAAAQSEAGSSADDLSKRRLEQQKVSTSTARRHVPWYARRPVQIAAGLMLVVGVGGVVARSTDNAADVSVQFETDMAPPTAGPAAVVQPTSREEAERVADLGGVKAESPRTPAPGPQTKTGAAAANQSPGAAGRAAAEAVADSVTGVAAGTGAAGAGTAGAGAVGGLERRQRGMVAEQQVAAVPSPPAPPVVAASPLPAAPVAPVVSSLRDSSLDRLAARRFDAASSEPLFAARSVAPIAGVLAGKVIAADDTPVAGATVVVAAASVSAQTAADGSFTLPPLPPGQYTVEARRIGYSPAKLEGVQLTSGDTSYARLALKENTLQLSEVVVSGAGFRDPRVGGACYNLAVDAGDAPGIPLLPRRVRIRLEQTAGGGYEQRRSAEAVGAPSAAGAMAGSLSEPARPLPWRALAADSIAATWATDADIITIALRIRGDNVSGTARSSVGSPARTARVTGQRVSCSSR